MEQYFISDYIEGTVREIKDDFYFEKGYWIDKYIEDDEVLIIKLTKDGSFSCQAKVNEVGPFCCLGRLYRLGDNVCYYWNDRISPLYTAVSTDYNNGKVYAAKTLYNKNEKMNSDFIDISNNIIQFYEITIDEVIMIEGGRKIFNPMDHKWFPYDFLEKTGLNDIGDAYNYDEKGYGWTLEDSWDALTDGMYGDMPDNPTEHDAMMDALGF